MKINAINEKRNEKGIKAITEEDATIRMKYNLTGKISNYDMLKMLWQDQPAGTEKEAELADEMDMMILYHKSNSGTKELKPYWA